ncbi:MAG: hypothetical protein QGI80_00950 [archaeon]|jgi:hypothetical protein|nr:hypothetical protein [archaeon]
MSSLFASILANLPGNSITLTMIWLFAFVMMLFVSEILFFYVPGVSISNLILTVVGMAFGFGPTFVIGFLSILPAHFILRKDMTMMIVSLFTLVPMVAISAFYGNYIVNLLGWPMLGFVVSVVKWGSSIVIGVMMGRAMPKKILNIMLEPLISIPVFWIFSGYFMWIFTL